MTGTSKGENTEHSETSPTDCVQAGEMKLDKISESRERCQLPINKITPVSTLDAILEQ